MTEDVRQFLISVGNTAEDVTPETVRVLADGTYIFAKALLFHWTVIKGDPLDFTGYSDRWCFPDKAAALEAVSAWPQDAGYDYEPAGWHRHPATNRYQQPA